MVVSRPRNHDSCGARGTNYRPRIMGLLMPIRPENKARYPKDWKTVVVPRIRARSGNRCECTGQCGVQHPDFVMVQAAEPPVIRMPNRCGRENGDYIDNGKDAIDWPRVVLTVAHLNHTPEHCDDANLLHLCQGCHLRYDAPRKHAEMKARRHAQRASGDLFQCEEAS